MNHKIGYGTLLILLNWMNKKLSDVCKYRLYFNKPIQSALDKRNKSVNRLELLINEGFFYKMHAYTTSSLLSSEKFLSFSV